MPGYEPRALQTMALGLAVGARGADHNRSGAYEVDFSDKVDRRHVTLDAVRHAIRTEDRAALMDSLISASSCAACSRIFTPSSGRCCAASPDGTSPPTSCAKPPHASSPQREFNCWQGGRRHEDTCPNGFSIRRFPTMPRAPHRERLDALVAESPQSTRLELDTPARAVASAAR
jgi:aldehyde:ferredoxin oxidoreductase